MSTYGELRANVRSGRGKGASRTIRRDGRIPAVLYGAGRDNVKLIIDVREFHKATDPERHWNTLYQLTLTQEGQPDQVEPCILSDVQRDSVRRDVVHLDFLRVDPEREVVRKVPVRYTGRSVGVVKGGKMQTFRRLTKIAAKPADIPIEVVVDVTSVDSGESLRLKDIPLTNARFVDHPEQRLCFVAMPKARKGDEEEDADPKKKK